MKNLIINMLWGAFLLLTTSGFSQDPVRNPDSIPDYSTVKGLVPDCDLPGVAPFRSQLNGTWIDNKVAGEMYAIVWDATGEVDNPTSEAALASAHSALSNPLVPGLYGHIASISFDAKTGKYCVSFRDQLQQFDGHFWCRINSNWSLWLRDGCANPVLVYDPAGEGKGVPEKFPCDPVTVFRDTGSTKIVYRDTGSVKCCTSEVKLEIKCCEPGKFKGQQVYLLAGYRTTFSTDLNPESPFLGLGVVQFFGDSSMNGSYRVGSEIVMMLRQMVACPTGNCNYFTDKNFLKPAMRWEVFFERRFDVPGTKLHADFGTRYTLFQPRTEQEKRSFLPKESGWTIGFNVVWTPAQGVEIKGGPEYDLLSKQAGGKIVATISFAALKAADQKAKTKRAEKARIRKAERDSVQFLLDSTAVAEFFVHNLDTVEIDRIALLPDSAYNDPEPQRVLWVIKKTPTTAKINPARAEVMRLQEEHNQLRLEMQTNPRKWADFQANMKELKKAEAKLARLEKKAGVTPGSDWRRAQ